MEQELLEGENMEAATIQLQALVKQNWCEGRGHLDKIELLPGKTCSTI